MSDKAKYENLQRIKLELADKYDRLANIAGSKPKHKQFRHRAVRHRRQAAEFGLLAERS